MMKSEAIGEQWENVDKIPTGDAFIEAFERRQEIFRKEEIRVTAFATIISKFKMNILKFDVSVFKFLQKKKNYTLNLTFLEERHCQPRYYHMRSPALCPKKKSHKRNPRCDLKKRHPNKRDYKKMESHEQRRSNRLCNS